MSHPPIRLAAIATAAALGCLALGSLGCRTVRPPVTTTDERFQPLYERSEVRSQLQRARRQHERAAGVERGVAHAAVELWEALEVLYAAPPDAAVDARQREADLIRHYLRAVEAASRKAESPDETSDPTEVGATVEVTFQQYFDALARAEAEGRYAEAITVAETLLEELEASGEPLLMTTRLRLGVGLWHLALGEYDEARAAFDAVQELRSEGDDLAERARLLVEELDLLQTLPPGDDRDALARGWALLETGNPEGAGALAR
jgi:tetratricopeptide (TPR) repeat protein